jgi:tripartite-type tricarboxylate transporter receptor subunit TctC
MHEVARRPQREIRLIARACLVVALGLCCQASAFAQSFPAKPVKISVGTTPGTAADIVARLLGQRLGELWRQNVVIENQPGTSGGISAAAVAKAPPDGYTLVMGFINHAINPSLYRDIPFDIIRDFKPIVRVAVAPMVFVANPSFPPNTIQELIALARSRDKSNLIFYGSAGSGSILNLSFELLKARASFDLIHTPYKGVSQMMTDLLGNQIPLGAPAVATALPLIASGKLKALAVTSAKRSSSLPNVPTVAESGVEGYDVSAWNGLLAPANTPDPIVAKIHADVVRVAQTREFIEQLNVQGMELALMNPAEFRSFFVSEVAKWTKLVKDTGAKLD